VQFIPRVHKPILWKRHTDVASFFFWWESESESESPPSSRMCFDMMDLALRTEEGIEEDRYGVGCVRTCA
jgi:hypothetical protein